LWWLTTVLPPVTSVSSGAVGHALASEGAFVFDAECEETRPGTRTCSVFDAATSGDVVYRVQMTSWRCWQAERVGGIGTGPPQLDGCVHLNDQLGL
jgi:hypothetical protein